MLKTTEKLIAAGYSNRIFKKVDFEAIFKGSAARRYGLMNKAIAAGEILRLKREVYFLAPQFHSKKISKFHLAGQLISSSYISLESALSFHGWIPESVVPVNCVLFSGRSQSFNTPIADYHFFKIPVNEYEFLTCVKREEFENAPFFMASPLRALSDLVYVKKLSWQGLDRIENDLRIEPDSLVTISKSEFKQIKNVYHSKRVLAFISELQAALGK